MCLLNALFILVRVILNAKGKHQKENPYKPQKMNYILYYFANSYKINTTLSDIF